MRALVFILIVLVILAIAAVATGYVNITNLRGQPPALTATRNSVSIKGGEPPAFDVEAGSVKVGTRQTTVTVPTSVQIRKPAQNQVAAATNNAM
jgi:hypothetical protein